MARKRKHDALAEQPNGSPHPVNPINQHEPDLANKKRKSTSTQKPHISPTPNQQPSLPPLPPIRTPSLQSLPFTHQGMLGNVPLSTATTQSYERLEFLGDAYLELISSRLLFSTFPTWTPGKLSTKREQLVKNETLAQFARKYGFQHRARVSEDVRAQKGWGKVLGDMFEAYVAAVVLDDLVEGYATAEGWLKELWAPMLERDLLPHMGNRDNTKESGTKLDFPKVELSKRVMGKGIHLTYTHEIPPSTVRKGSTPAIFKIGAYLTGWGYENICLGRGEGLNKTTAGDEAALRALENPLTAEIEAIKRAFDEKVRAEREREREKETTDGAEVG